MSGKARQRNKERLKEPEEVPELPEEVLESPKPSKGKKKLEKTNPEKTNPEKTKQSQKVDKEIIPAPKGDHWVKDLFVKGVIVAIAAVCVQLVPLAKVDVQKPANASFYSLYFAGGLDGVLNVTQMLIACLVSFMLDFAVVYYHLANPPHPKFRMIFVRRLSIFTHLISGIIEIVSGIVAFTVVDQSIQQAFTRLLSIASITHSITAYIQTGVVFGAKGIMTPGYLYAITAHITFAFRLFNQPTSLVFLLTTYLMLHIYVWCRFFVFVFRAFSAFEGYHYTIAITLSGALLFPYAMGPLGNYVFLGIATVYCVLEAMFSDKFGKDLARKLFAEHERYALVSSETVTAWKEKLADQSGMNADQKAAQDVFDMYDTNKSGKLGVTEVEQIVRAMGVHDHTTVKIMAIADITGDEALSFDEFYRLVWNVGNVKSRLQKKPKTTRPPSDIEQARIVFDMLDVDGSKIIEVGELQMLLTQWGMPEDEASAYLYEEKKAIDFENFYKNLKPVWQFAITEVFDA